MYTQLFLPGLTAPSAAVQGLSGVNTSSTSLHISWEPPPSDDQNGVIRSYNISYGPGAGDVSTYTHTTAQNTSIELSGLEKFTEYSVTVRAFTIAVGPGSTVTVRTDTDSELEISNAYFLSANVMYSVMYVYLDGSM